MNSKIELLTGKLRPIKAEILFTRRCPLLCDYCGITTATVGKKKELSIADWMLGLDQLKALGVPFLAIYGGEPTVRFDDLCLFVRGARDRGFQLSVISACVGMTPAKWDKLIDHGLDSLTVSLDSPPGALWDQPQEQASRGSAVETALLYVRNQPLIRDVEISMTVSASNLQQVIPMLDWAALHGYWVHFDVQHPDRGQPGSKCRGKYPAFMRTHLQDIRDVFLEVLERKLKGARIHESKEVLLDWVEGRLPLSYEWKCTDPFWLSVDCDGSMMICDDSIDAGVAAEFSVTNIHDKWPSFLTAWYAWRERSECHCFWSTHKQAGEQSLDPAGATSISHGRG